MAVERHPGFEAEHVARAEPARFETGLAVLGEQRIPHGRGFFGREEDLEAVLAGVARARDDDRLAQAFQARLGAGVVFHRGQVGFDVRLQPFDGARALDRDERAVAVQVRRLDVAGEVAADVRPHLVGVAGVDDEQPAVLVEPVEDDVVVRAAVLVGEDVVARLTGLHVRDLVDGQRLGPGADVGAAQIDLLHVREVEQAPLACGPPRAP